jgi:hypothetical protein
LLNEAKTIKNSADNLNGIIDGGKSNYLLQLIQTASPGVIKDSLLAYSPYLSDRVLIAALQRTPALPHGHVKAICIANSPLSVNVSVVLNTINLPNGIRQQISNAQQNTYASPRQLLENEQQSLSAEAQLLVNEAVRMYLDSNEVDSAIVALQEYGTAEARCLLVPIAVNSRMFLTAQRHLDTLETLAVEREVIDPQDPKANELRNYCTYHRFIIPIIERTNAYFDMSNSEKQTIENLANSISPMAIHVRTILALINDTMFEQMPEELYFASNRIENEKEEIIENKTIVFDSSKKIKASPNPCNNNVLISFQMPENNNYGSLKVIEILSGKEVFSANINETRGEYLINTTILNSGVYLLSIIGMETGEQVSTKLIKISN